MLNQPQQQVAMRNLLLLIMVISYVYLANITIIMSCNVHMFICCYSENVTTTQREDVEPHILQRLSFSVTPECK